MRVKLAGEGFPTEVVGAALEELERTRATTAVRYPLRYCLTVARRLEQQRAARAAQAEADAAEEARASAARGASAAYDEAVDAVMARLLPEEQVALRRSVLEQLTRELRFAPAEDGRIVQSAMRLAAARRAGLPPRDEPLDALTELLDR